MATVNKDFKIKSGLIVEGSTATVNGYDILTKKQGDQDYIVGLIGGTSTSQNTPDTVVKRDGSGNFAAGTITANLVGDVTGTVSSLSNHTTSDLSEGTNKYFTNQRALDATSAAYDAAGAASTAQQNAEDYADTVSGTAETNAKSYADGLAGNYDPAGSAATAEDNANSYTDTAITNLNLSGTYDALGAAQTAENNAKGYTDQEIAALVDSAPAMLDTLNELAAAIADNPNYATDVTNLVATKADTTYVDSQDQYYDGLASGYATTAQTNAQNYADTAAGNAEDAANLYTDNAITALNLAGTYDALGAAATALQDAKDYADALDTDDVAEATNQYFTDARAKSSAADLLTGATLTNITITGSGSGLTITAENGVADSNTDQLAEGTNHLYFTDQRVLDAASNAAQVEVQALDITWVRREEATYHYAASASTVVAHTFPNWKGSAKYLVRVQNNGKSHLTELLATTDSSNNVAVVEYGTIYTSENPLATATVEWNAGANQYELKVTTANNSSEVLVAATLIVYGD